MFEAVEGLVTERHELEIDLEVLQGSLRSATVALHVALGEDDGQAATTLEHAIEESAGGDAITVVTTGSDARCSRVASRNAAGSSVNSRGMAKVSQSDAAPTTGFSGARRSD